MMGAIRAVAAPLAEADRAHRAAEVGRHIKSLIGVAPGEVLRSQGKAVRVRDLQKGT